MLNYSNISPEESFRILDFLNKAKSVDDILNPNILYDDPTSGLGDQINDPTIGALVALRILEKRDSREEKVFTKLEQLNDIQGFGQDKLQDLVFSLNKWKATEKQKERSIPQPIPPDTPSSFPSYEPKEDIKLEDKDIGNLEKVLRSYYKAQINTLEGWKNRRLARELIEDHLVLPKSQQRTSKDGAYIREKLGIEGFLLERLEDTRLIRKISRRGINPIYEVSHDTLVEPILAERRNKAMLWLYIKKWWWLCLLLILLLPVAGYFGGHLLWPHKIKVMDIYLKEPISVKIPNIETLTTLPESIPRTIPIKEHKDSVLYEDQANLGVTERSSANIFGTLRVQLGNPNPCENPPCNPPVPCQNPPCDSLPIDSLPVLVDLGHTITRSHTDNANRISDTVVNLNSIFSPLSPQETAKEFLARSSIQFREGLTVISTPDTIIKEITKINTQTDFQEVKTVIVTFPNGESFEMKNPFRGASLTGSLEHKVKKGENLFKIAKKYGIKVNELRRINNLRSDNLDIGQKLIINE